MSSSAAPKSGDGLGSYDPASKSGDKSSSTPGVSAEMDGAEMRSALAGIATANGTATKVSDGIRVQILSKVYGFFGARTEADKKTVNMVLTYYFAVHGTSPDTEWARYGMEYPIVSGGVKVDPLKVVSEIGIHRLKKFMGGFTKLAIQMIGASPEFAAAMSERAARANLPPGQEYLAIDFVGKDGSLSAAEASARVRTRESLLNYRAGNAVNVSTERKENSQVNAAESRGLGGRPLLNFSS